MQTSLFGTLISIIAFAHAFKNFQNSGRLGRVSSVLNMMSSESKPKKVLVLGGDGFCGWPTSLYLSERG